jgi:hypothetical protein
MNYLQVLWKLFVRKWREFPHAIHCHIEVNVFRQEVTTDDM